MAGRFIDGKWVSDSDSIPSWQSNEDERIVSAYDAAMKLNAKDMFTEAYPRGVQYNSFVPDTSYMKGVIPAKIRPDGMYEADPSIPSPSANRAHAAAGIALAKESEYKAFNPRIIQPAFTNKPGDEAVVKSSSGASTPQAELAAIQQQQAMKVASINYKMQALTNAGGYFVGQMPKPQTKTDQAAKMKMLEATAGISGTIATELNMAGADGKTPIKESISRVIKAGVSGDLGTVDKTNIDDMKAISQSLPKRNQQMFDQAIKKLESTVALKVKSAEDFIKAEISKNQSMTPDEWKSVSDSVKSSYGGSKLVDPKLDKLIDSMTPKYTKMMQEEKMAADIKKGLLKDSNTIGLNEEFDRNASSFASQYAGPDAPLGSYKDQDELIGLLKGGDPTVRALYDEWHSNNKAWTFKGSGLDYEEPASYQTSRLSSVQTRKNVAAAGGAEMDDVTAKLAGVPDWAIAVKARKDPPMTVDKTGVNVAVTGDSAKAVASLAVKYMKDGMDEAGAAERAAQEIASNGSGKIAIQKGSDAGSTATQFVKWHADQIHNNIKAMADSEYAAGALNMQDRVAPMINQINQVAGGVSPTESQISGWADEIVNSKEFKQDGIDTISDFAHAKFQSLAGVSASDSPLLAYAMQQKGSEASAKFAQLQDKLVSAISAITDKNRKEAVANLVDVHNDAPLIKPFLSEGNGVNLDFNFMEQNPHPVKIGSSLVWASDEQTMGALAHYDEWTNEAKERWGAGSERLWTVGQSGNVYASKDLFTGGNPPFWKPAYRMLAGENKSDELAVAMQAEASKEQNKDSYITKIGEDGGSAFLNKLALKSKDGRAVVKAAVDGYGNYTPSKGAKVEELAKNLGPGVIADAVMFAKQYAGSNPTANAAVEKLKNKSVTGENANTLLAYVVGSYLNDNRATISRNTKIASGNVSPVVNHAQDIFNAGASIGYPEDGMRFIAETEGISKIADALAYDIESVQDTNAKKAILASAFKMKERLEVDNEKFVKAASGYGYVPGEYSSSISGLTHLIDATLESLGMIGTLKSYEDEAAIILDRKYNSGGVSWHGAGGERASTNRRPSNEDMSRELKRLTFDLAMKDAAFMDDEEARSILLSEAKRFKNQ